MPAAPGGVRSSRLAGTMPAWGRCALVRPEALARAALLRRGFGRCGMVVVMSGARQVSGMPGVELRSAPRLMRRAARR
jgi:hypothetical protein